MDATLKTVHNSASEEFTMLAAELAASQRVFDEFVKRCERINDYLSDYGDTIFNFSLPRDELINAISKEICAQAPINYDHQAHELADNICAELFELMFKRHRLVNSLMELVDGTPSDLIFSLIPVE
ncbi:unnamed protein product [Dibothriocephalus latus]|uniref:Uncharacterized protein n=1 Tax=Dibothriocephalus latus TaxID=60516 RepID=A0A3P7MTA3_DIBLA|nr:unnamed protein product [Dibothriocephalus latus]